MSRRVDPEERHGELVCIPGPYGPRLVPVERDLDNRDYEAEHAYLAWGPSCGFCGQTGHARVECLVAPIDDGLRA